MRKTLNKKKTKANQKTETNKVDLRGLFGLKKCKNEIWKKKIGIWKSCPTIFDYFVRKRIFLAVGLVDTIYTKYT